MRCSQVSAPAVIEAAGARLREAVDKGEPIAALTGAGVSAESGIPTFRGAGGFWEGFRAEDLATPEAFRENPEKVWEWYHWRRRFVLDASPNPAHRALAALEWVHPRFTLITQNVDGLHRLAGHKRRSDQWDLPGQPGVGIGPGERARLSATVRGIHKVGVCCPDPRHELRQVERTRRDVADLRLYDRAPCVLQPKLKGVRRVIAGVIKGSSRKGPLAQALCGPLA